MYSIYPSIQLASYLYFKEIWEWLATLLKMTFNICIIKFNMILVHEWACFLCPPMQTSVELIKQPFKMAQDTLAYTQPWKCDPMHLKLHSDMFWAIGFQCVPNTYWGIGESTKGGYTAETFYPHLFSLHPCDMCDYCLKSESLGKSL